MINSIDDIMKLVNAGFNASQIAELAKLGETPKPSETQTPPHEPSGNQSSTTQEPSGNQSSTTQEPEKANPEIEALKAQVAALQAANVAANVGGAARQETASDVIANVLKDFY